MDELIFRCMDIVEETKNFLNDHKHTICVGMTESEKKAYECGIKNFASALKSLCDCSSNEVVVHIDGFDGFEQFTYDELKERILGI